ncbi:hypothetical protein ZWY2020_052588 [Hordeum vulgare]|nr:hypothetical protein ZWY2020_052588 [Hordeum vulgare]
MEKPMKKKVAMAPRGAPPWALPLGGFLARHDPLCRQPSLVVVCPATLAARRSARRPHKRQGKASDSGRAEAGPARRHIEAEGHPGRLRSSGQHCVDMKDQKMTVIGTVDLVAVALCYAVKTRGAAHIKGEEALPLRAVHQPVRVLLFFIAE